MRPRGPFQSLPCAFEIVTETCNFGFRRSITAMSPVAWFAAVERTWLLYHLHNLQFRFMFEAPPANEWVALDCESTGLNVNTD